MSSKPEILVVAALPPQLEQRLAADFKLVKSRPEAGLTLPHAVLVTTSMAGLDTALMESLPNLALIACNGAGLDLIDLDGAKRRGIVVCNTPDAVTEDTAEFAIGLIYALLRRVAEGDRFVRAGRWRTERMTPSRRVFSRHIGIVGVGRIGRAVAGRAAALGMTVSYNARSAKSELPYAYFADPVSLARAVDILVLCCPGGAQTAGLAGRKVIEALGSGGFLVNISRGSVVDEQALIEALQEKRIAGAALDVFDNEPAIDERFFSLENVVLQPHYASVTHETRQAMADILHAAISSQLAAS